MDKSLIEEMRQALDLRDMDAHSYSPLVLAYLGDAIYDLVIRTMVVSRGNTQVNKLHKMTSSLVKAQKQSEMIAYLEPMFTEEEEQVYKRGRNAKSYTSAKNADIIDYRRATGFEAVMGYLYLKGDMERLYALVKASLESETR